MFSWPFNWQKWKQTSVEQAGMAGLPIPEEDSEKNEAVEYKAPGSVPSPDDEWRGNPGWSQTKA